METKDYLTNYYERYDENGRLISKHGMVEYLTTMKYVEKYLNPNMRVLEIGAATGRYSHALAQKGYRVDAVELVEHNIEIFKQNTIEGEPVTITQGIALQLIPKTVFLVINVLFHYVILQNNIFAHTSQFPDCHTLLYRVVGFSCPCFCPYKVLGQG